MNFKKMILPVALACSLVATSVYSRDITQFQTRGDMTDAELSAIIEIRELRDNFLDYYLSASRRLGDSILASTFGFFVDAAGVVFTETSMRNNEIDRENRDFLEEMSDDTLLRRYRQVFLNVCRREAQINPTEMIFNEDTGATEQRPLDCYGALERSLEVDAEIARDMKIEFLMQVPHDQSAISPQTVQIIRAAAVAGGTALNIVSLAAVQNAVRDYRSAENAVIPLREAVNNLHGVALQAQMEGRTNNPLMNIANCNTNFDISRQIRNLETARTINIVGLVGSGVALTGSVISLSQGIDTSRGVDIASMVGSGVSQAANGVSVGIVVANQRTIRRNSRDFMDCIEWLFWDINGHSFH